MHIYYLFNYLIILTNFWFFYKFLHIFQLKDYNNSRYLKYFLNKKIIFLITSFVLFILQIFINNFWFYLTTNIVVYVIYIIFLKNLIKSKKTPVKYTNKLIRLYIIAIFLLLVLAFYKHSFLLSIVLSPFLPIFANILNMYDKIKNRKFIKSAQKKLQAHKTKIIAITGSNGKTSVKNILSKMLATQYKVQHTPASFNTPLGISKFINNELKNETEYLILEYGARHRNDIKKLCNLFGADYGIITIVSPQHLETFKSVENIFKAKQELANFLQNKPCVFNVDNLHTYRMFENKVGIKLSASIYNHANVNASNIKLTNGTTKFNLHLNNISFPAETMLLGKHNVLNICLCAALANHLNISNENIIEVIKNLEPTQHRLELIKTHINILDDSYNCSLTSATESLDVLKSFKNKKMVVTPGIIECGKEKHKINFRLGKMISFCDYIVIVGNENKIAIKQGINTTKKQVSAKPKLIFVKNLDEAKQHFSLLKEDDCLLLLNDLPDDYN